MTITKLYFTLLMLNIALMTRAQPGFNLVKDLGMINNHYRDMIVDNDTLVCYGLAASDSSADWRQGLLLSKFDSLGNHLFSNFIVDSMGNHLFIGKDWGKISKTSDGGYVLTSAPVSGDVSWFIKLDHDLEVDFIRKYVADTANFSQFYYERPIELADGFILFGRNTRPNNLLDGVVRRVDNQGNPLWFNYYGDYNVHDGFTDLKPINDTLFVGVGVSIHEAGSRSFLKIIDWHGNVLDSWQSGPDPEIGWLRKVLPTEDRGFITYGLYLIEEIGFAKIVQSTLAKLDSNYQVEWIRHFGRATSQSAEIELRDIEPTSDGHYIGAGESVLFLPNDPDLRVSWLYKFSAQGDSLWSRRDHPPLPIQLGNAGYLTGVGELSSGNIVAGGAAYEGTKYYGWLIKVTPDGCLDTICNLATAIEEQVIPSLRLKLYPNPSNGQFTLEWPGAVSAKSARFTLTDAGGRRVWREERSVSLKMEFNLSRLSPGLYFLHTETEDWQGVEKIFISY